VPRQPAALLPLICGLLATGWVFAADLAEPPQTLRTDSDAPYVHRITLYDEDGAAIDPTDETAGPYSPRATCGKCHDYSAISSGWHFNEPHGALPGRPGEPWFLVDRETGAVWPISGRGWPGTQTPAAAGMTDWQFVLRFGHHTPGGGYGAPTAAEINAAPESVRWHISSQLEIDCLFCHSTGQQHDPAVAAQQIEVQNFKWAPTAALGLAVVRGEARKAPDDWDPLAPPNPDYPEQAGPRLVWDRTRFDPDDRVFFDVTRRVPNERCLFCHTVREVGIDAESDLLSTRDVHLAAGLLCVDCHRNTIDHATVRGYDGEAADRGMPALAAYSCAGCHLGTPDPDDPDVSLGGRYGAPHPEHRGLPPVHFDKLTCTACHSGPLPRLKLQQFQTALAHGLGLASRDRTNDDPPLILGPVFAQQSDGRIAPQRMVWYAGSSDLQPYRWSLAHNVRPASQSLGIGDCTDCHAEDGAVFFGQVIGADGKPVSMTAFRGDDEAEARIWALGFTVRPVFKVFGLVCAALIALVLVRYVLQGFRGEPPTRRGFSLYERLFHYAAILGALVQFATALVIRPIVGEMEGWLLLAHMSGAGLFTLGFTGTVLQWAPRCRFGPGPAAAGLTRGQRLMFWPGVVLGLVLMSAMLVAMLPVFGTEDQHALTEIHATAAWCFAAVMVLHTLVSLWARRLTNEGRST
jgi:hypothetical protein